MMTGAVSRRVQELTAEGTAFVTATVVRAQRPTSAQAGDVALVLADGTIEGFVGGVCAQNSVRVYALRALETGEALLLRILPEGPVDDPDVAGREIASEEGAVTVQNTCLSGGAIEIFLDPVLPAPRVLVVGDSPVAAAIRSLGAQLGLELVTVDGGSPQPAPGDLALVVAAHGRDELHTLRRGLEARVPYVGLVASRRRGAGVLDALRADGVSEQELALIDVPAGLDIGSRTPPEIALSILAAIISVRRAERRDEAVPEPATPRAAAPQLAIDPVCGMTVAAVAGTPSVEYEGETVYFCCEGCAARFAEQHDLVAGA
jgi:xanthine dehydrogenase accessory factor